MEYVRKLVDTARAWRNSAPAPASPAKTLRQKLLGGSITMLAGSGLVGVTNFIYNVATARLLGPTGFANTTAVYTLLMLLSAITLTFQVVCAKYVANHDLLSEKAEVFESLHRRAWITGIGIGLLLFVTRTIVARYLNLPDPMLIILLALGTAFYVPLGVRRGYVQGVHAFGPLAVNFMLEGVVRLVDGTAQLGEDVVDHRAKASRSESWRTQPIASRPRIRRAPLASSPAVDGLGSQPVRVQYSRGRGNRRDLV